MKAADVMATNVISVGSEASVQEVAEVLLRNRVSGVPVTGPQGELIGIVSEGDLMRRPEAGTQRRHSWWLHLVASKEGLASEYIKSHSRKVVDVMSRNVVTASLETPVGDVAELLERHAIKRVPIVRDGKVVGIVSRANLLQALASLKNMPAGKTDDAHPRQADGQARKRALDHAVSAQPHRARWNRRPVGDRPIADGKEGGPGSGREHGGRARRE
jgi:CBS-domain-containing membrane protein